MKQGQQRRRGWARFLVDVAEVKDPIAVERRTRRSLSAFLIWVVGGLVIVALLVWQLLGAQGGYTPSVSPRTTTEIPAAHASTQ